MPFNIADIISDINQVGVLKTNRFTVAFNLPPGLMNYNVIGLATLHDTSSRIRVYAEGASLPGVGILTHEVSRYGYGHTHKKPIKPLFNDWNCDFRGDGDGRVFDLMRTWIRLVSSFEVGDEGMNTPTGSTPGQYPGELGYIEDYATQVAVTVYRDDGDAAIQIMLRDAFPVQLPDVPLNWGRNNEYMRIPVTFAFADWSSSAVQAIAAQNLEER